MSIRSRIIQLLVLFSVVISSTLSATGNSEIQGIVDIGIVEQSTLNPLILGNSMYFSSIVHNETGEYFSRLHSIDLQNGDTESIVDFSGGVIVEEPCVILNLFSIDDDFLVVYLRRSSGDNKDVLIVGLEINSWQWHKSAERSSKNLVMSRGVTNRSVEGKVVSRFAPSGDIMILDLLSNSVEQVRIPEEEYYSDFDSVIMGENENIVILGDGFLCDQEVTLTFYDYERSLMVGVLRIPYFTNLEIQAFSLSPDHRYFCFYHDAGGIWLYDRKTEKIHTIIKNKDYPKYVYTRLLGWTEDSEQIIIRVGNIISAVSLDMFIRSNGDGVDTRDLLKSQS